VLLSTLSDPDAFRQSLIATGAHVDSVANWHGNVVVDRELITGQQPMSANEFGDVLVVKLAGRKQAAQSSGQ
jgi:putative intracellular protease/amidase